jgi:hypothetical protein
MSLPRWTAQQAWDWYNAQPWLLGCNFIPSTAINQLEMWQAETFDPATIERELGWAAGLGFNTARVFLHDLLWDGPGSDRAGFLARLDQFLTICQGRRIRPLLVFFDDCWNQHPQTGAQPAPRPGIHNSGWVQSPGSAVVADPSGWGRLEGYVQGVLAAFGRDQRILAWDLYNEPGNNQLGETSLPLLKAVFAWARAAVPVQPLTAGIWYDHAALNIFSLAASDFISFHEYRAAPETLRAKIASLKTLERPLICTEYMARQAGSLFQHYLPVLKEEGVGAYNWGLVSGKTQTIYPWGSPGGEPEPSPWFHDIFRADGTPYDPAEVEAIQSVVLT